MSLQAPRTPTDFSRRGFLPLDNNMNYDQDIPLSNVRTSMSTTGARKHDGGAVEMDLDNDEKKGFFKRGAGGKRKLKKMDSKSRRVGTDGEEEHVNGLGRFYNRLVNFSIVTRYFVYVLPVALVLAAPIIIYAVLDPNALFASTGMKVIWFWLWIEIVWLSLWVSKLFAKAVPAVFMFLCGVVSSGTRKYALILRAVETPIAMVAWAVTSLVTFTALTNLDGQKKLKWVTITVRVLVPILIASIIFLIEKLAIQAVSVNYHRRSFDARIQESKHIIYLLGLFYDASRALFPMYCPEFLEEDYVINESIEGLIAKTTGHTRSGSATPLKLIGEVGRLGDKVTSVFGNLASEITGKKVFNSNSAHSIVVEALEKTKSSEALAKRLWMSFVMEGKESLSEEDIIEVLGPARKEEAEEAFQALDSDGNGDISLDEMIMKVVEIGRDRKAIARSMRDVGQAIGVLDHVCVTVISVIVIFVFVAFQDTNFLTTLATAGTTLLSLSFVFAATTQEFLGSCIFLFVKHPYDVGDRVDIVGTEKEYLVVEQIALLFTVFKRIDNMKVVQVPNIVLNNLWIENITRSKAMKEQLDMFISFDTSLEDVEVLRREMEKFVRSRDNARDFHPDIVLEAVGIGNMDKLQLKVEIKHKGNWHNETVRAARRSKFMCALVLALRKVPIYAPGGGGDPLGGPANPGYSVSISDSWAAEARDKAAKAKESKRLVPSAETKASGKSTGIDLGSPSETRAAGALNARPPAADSAHRDIDAHDDKTLGSRNQSLEGQRSDDIDNLREGLVQRQPTVGRRKPGETAPPVRTGPDGPAMSLTQASPRRDGGFMGNSGQFDEEAQVGVYPSNAGELVGSSPTDGPAAYTGPGHQTNPSGSYSMFPATTTSPSGSSNTRGKN